MLTDKKFDLKKMEEASIYANAFSNPMRLMILKTIATSNECITGELEFELPIKRTTIVQHLQELKKIGVLKGNVKGKKIYYCIDYDRINYIKSLLCEAIDIPEPNYVCCEDKFETIKILNK
ncbi:hypothetical protein MASR1M45_03840 [Candidatus Kapaibacterium sp.]